MRLYVHGYLVAEYNEIFDPLVADGVDVHVLDPSLSAHEIYDELLEADAVLVLYNDHNAELGTVLGMAIAFGKATYIVQYAHPENRFYAMDGVRWYHDLYDVLPDLRADLKEMATDGTRLDEAGGDAGDGSAGPGTAG